MEARVSVGRYSLYAFAGGALAQSRRIIRFVFAVCRVRLFRMFGAFRPYFFGLYRVVYVVRSFRSLFITDFNDDVFLIRIVRSVACAGAIATRLVDVDQTSAFSNDACFDVPLDNFVDDVRGAIYERGRVHFL